MMDFLVTNITTNRCNLANIVRKCSIPLLPRKTPHDQTILINPNRRISFNFFNQVGKRFRGFKIEKKVNMVFNSTDGEHFMSMILDNGDNILK